uniref:Uncharacterized protein n=1 Tax=viral metagenome TaxID=1070528 RepID=A0A6C0JS10_9ZZZZ
MKTKINVGIIGTPGCGKTSFVRRHVDGQYCSDEFQHTPHVVLDIVDTNNGQRHQVDARMIESEYIPDVDEEKYPIDAFIVLFVVNNVSSYEFAKNRVDEILDSYPSSVPVAICGTMNDMPRQLRGLIRDLSVFCAETGCEPCLLSSKTGDQINKPFIHIIQTIFNNDGLELIQPKYTIEDNTNIINMQNIVKELDEIRKLDAEIKNTCPKCGFQVVGVKMFSDFVYCTNPNCNNAHGFHN